MIVIVALVTATSSGSSALMNASVRVHATHTARIVAFFDKVGQSKEDVRDAKFLDWAGKGLDDKDCKVISQLMRSGALDKLQYLYLHENKIGDAGMVALAEACRASGALDNLKELNLFMNKIGDAGMSALADACARGGLAQLRELKLYMNHIGDAGMSALAGACASGALANLEQLELYNNNISDEGMHALATAVAGGALASCRFLDLDGNPGSGAPVRQALAARKK